MKRLLKVGAVVAVLALAAVAVGGAATSAQEGEGPFGTFLAKVAEKLGVTEDELKGAIDEARVETIDEAVAQGRLTEEQAERLKERAEEGGFRLPGLLLAAKRHVGPDFYVIEAARQVLDITRDDLSEQAKDGKSLAEIAAAQGMSVENFQAVLLAKVKAQLDDQVAAGDLTQEHADRIFQAAEDNIDQIVSGELGPRGLGRQRHAPGRFGWPCWFGPPSDEAPESTEPSETTAY
jgi:transcriptional regulator with XRE-family HTH domain